MGSTHKSVSLRVELRNLQIYHAIADSYGYYITLYMFILLHSIKDIYFLFTISGRGAVWTSLPDALHRKREAIRYVPDHIAQCQVFIYSFIQHLFIECLESARLCSRQGDTAVSKQRPWSYEAYALLVPLLGSQVNITQEWMRYSQASRLLVDCFLTPPNGLFTTVQRIISIVSISKMQIQ